MGRPGVRFAHAWATIFPSGTRRSFPAATGGGREVRRVRGRRMGDPGAGCPPAPADPAGPASRALLSGPLGPWRGPLGCLAAPALRRFLSGTAASCSRLARSIRAPGRPCAFGGRRTPAPLLALRRQRSQRASRISVLQHEGLPSRRRSLPRWVLVSERPVAGSDGHYGTAPSPGITLAIRVQCAPPT